MFVILSRNGWPSMTRIWTQWMFRIRQTSQNCYGNSSTSEKTSNKPLNHVLKPRFIVVTTSQIVTKDFRKVDRKTRYVKACEKRENVPWDSFKLATCSKLVDSLQIVASDSSKLVTSLKLVVDWLQNVPCHSSKLIMCSKLVVEWLQNVASHSKLVADWLIDQFQNTLSYFTFRIVANKIWKCMVNWETSIITFKIRLH